MLGQGASPRCVHLALCAADRRSFARRLLNGVGGDVPGLITSNYNICDNICDSLFGALFATACTVQSDSQIERTDEIFLVAETHDKSRAA